jgi:hypothetical protein
MFILFCHAGRFPKLQTCHTIWIKESNGSCNCVVLFKHVRKCQTETIGYGKIAKPSLGALWESQVPHYANINALLTH